MTDSTSPFAASPRDDALPPRDRKAPPARPARRFLRIAAWGAGGLFGLVAVAAAGVYGAAEWKLHAKRDYVAMPLAMAPSPALVAEGERDFHIFGCYGCHGEKGNVLFDDPMVARVVAPDLHERARLYDDEQLVTLIRRGVKYDGTTAIVMPVNTTGRIADSDLAAIISWLRTLPEPSGEPGPQIAVGPVGYVAVAAGKVVLSAEVAPSEAPPRARPEGGEGAYLSAAICQECHNLDTVFDNGFGMVTPALRESVPGYSLDEFRTLLRTGKGLGDRDLGLMSEVAVKDHSRFTDAEIAAIFTWLGGN
jgi:mono/diheme cytochrome c family protein